MPRPGAVRRLAPPATWRADPGASATRSGCGIRSTTASTRSPEPSGTARSRGCGCAREPLDRHRRRTARRRRRASPGTDAFPWRFWIAGDPTVSPFRWGRGAGPALALSDGSAQARHRRERGAERAHAALVARREVDEQRAADPEPQPPRHGGVDVRDPRPELATACTSSTTEPSTSGACSRHTAPITTSRDRDDAERDHPPQARRSSARSREVVASDGIVRSASPGPSVGHVRDRGVAPQRAGAEEDHAERRRERSRVRRADGERRSARRGRRRRPAPPPSARSATPRRARQQPRRRCPRR